MAVRLRPQSSAWLAPTALAAQLTAQTGQIAGQGVAGLLGGIAQGVGAFTAKREARRQEAINESRYQDSLARQDRAFQYGAAKDQAALLEDYLKGAEVEVALSVMSSPTQTPDPSKVENLRTAQSSAQALRAQLAKIGGVQAANVPPMPAPPPKGPLMGDTPELKARYEAAVGFESLSIPELETVSAGLASEAEAIKAEMDSMLKIGGTKAAAMMASKRTALAEKSRDAMIAAAVLKRKAAAEKQTQERDEKTFATNEQIRADVAKKANDTASDEAERARINAARVARGERPIESLRELGPQMSRESAASRQQVSIEANKARADVSWSRKMTLEESKQAGRRELLDIANQHKDAESAVRAMQSRVNEAQDVADLLLKEYNTLKKLNKDGLIANDDPDLMAAYGKYAEARQAYIGLKTAMDASTPKPAVAPVATAPSPASQSDGQTFATEAEAQAAFNRDPRSQSLPVGSPERKALAAEYKARVRR